MSPAKQGHLAMFLFSVLVAGSFSLGALAANDIAPGALNAVRFELPQLSLAPRYWRLVECSVLR